MRTYLILAATAASLAFPAVASATECAYSPKETWKSVADVTTKVAAMGYDVRKVEIDDNCYEVYGVKDGVRQEIYLDPVSAEIVKVEADD
jgi:hypothetical protein